jgi:DNA-binding response OmpR family regulator
MKGWTPVNKNRVLIVDDNEDLRTVFQMGLERRGFEVIPAGTVNEALRLICTEKFDVLISDLHMPDAGDGFTVVSAMRHAQPHTVTLVLSGYPALQDAMNAILQQADQVLMKPIGVAEVTEIIQKKLSNPSARIAANKERVAAILERDLDPTIQNWMSRVEPNEELTTISLNHQERTGHLPRLLGDLVRRLRAAPGHNTAQQITTQQITTQHDPMQLNSSLTSIAARQHGALRRMQGYSVAMIVEESRILQVCIFNTLQNNLATVDFDTVLLDVMTIADEVDSQLKQAMLGFMEPPVAMAASQPA